MGDKKTTKNLLYLLCVVLIIVAALIIYGSYGNKAQAPTLESSNDITNANKNDQLTEAASSLAEVEALATDELDELEEDIISIDLSDI